MEQDAMEPTVGDTLETHDPPTFADLCSIEEALADGSVAGAEKARLEAIHQAAVAPLKETILKIGETLSARIADSVPNLSKNQFRGLEAAFNPGGALQRLATRSFGPTFDTKSLIPSLDYVQHMGLAGLVDSGALAALKRAQFGTVVGPALGARFGTVVPKEPAIFRSAVRPLPVVLPGLDPDVFIDKRPLRMEELASEQNQTLQIVASELKKVAEVMEQADEQQELRHHEMLAMGRHQFHVIVTFSLIGTLLGLAGLLAMMLLGV